MVYSTSADSQGENQPVTPQVAMPDEVDSTSRKRGLWASSGGGDQSYTVNNRIQKAGRTCYMCGSPGHFIRDCPMASMKHPMFHLAISLCEFQNETDFYTDQMHTLQTSIPTPPANFRLRDDHLSGSSMKAPRSFFSLSSFRSKGSDSTLR